MNNKIIAVILAGIFLFQAIPLVVWIKKDNSNPSWDQSFHAMISLNRYNQFVGKADLGTPQVGSIYPVFSFVNNYYPPFFHISSIPFYLIFGYSYDSALLTNLFFLLILLISSFFIGKKLANNLTGLVMAFLVSTIPFYNTLMKDYLIDFSLSAMVALGFALLLYSRNFENFTFSLLFGLVFGLGILTKWTYALFLIVFIFFSLFSFFKKNLYHKKNFSKLKNVLLPVLIALIVVSTWLPFSRIKALLLLISNFAGKGSAEGDPSFTTLNGITHYLTIMINDFSFFYFSLFIVAIVFFILNLKNKRINIILLSQILLIYIIFTLLSNKDPRYIAPIYIFLAAFSSIWAASLKNIKIKYSIILIIFIIGILQIVFYNFSFSNINYRIGSISLLNTQGKYPGISNFDIDAILLSIKKDSNGNPFSVCVISESEELNDVNIAYYAFLGNYPVTLLLGDSCNPLKFNYSIVGPIHDTWRKSLFEDSKLSLINNIDSFKEIYSSKKVVVYKRSQSN